LFANGLPRHYGEFYGTVVFAAVYANCSVLLPFKLLYWDILMSFVKFLGASFAKSTVGYQESIAEGKCFSAVVTFCVYHL